MNFKRALALMLMTIFLSAAMNAQALEIKFSGQVKNRGTTRDLTWGRQGELYSNFKGGNVFGFNNLRLNRQQNNPLNQSVQPYGSDAGIAGQNLRGRSAANSHGGIGAGTNNEGSASFWDTRALVGMQAIVSENLKGVFLFQFGQYDWGSYATSVGTNNEPFLVNNAYIDFKIPTTPVRAVVGLAPMKLGHGVLLQDDVAMLKLGVDLDAVSIQAFAIKATEGQRIADDDDDIYGFNADFNLGDSGVLSAYALMRRRNTNGGSSLSKRMGDMNVSYLGVSGDLKFDNVAVACEFIWEHGSIANPPGGYSGYTGGDDVNIDAVLAYLDASVDLDVAKVGVAILYATGNNNNTNAVQGGGENQNAFIAISPTDSYDRGVLNWDELFVREILANNVSNLFSPKWYVTVHPTDTISITFQNQWYWQDRSDDGGGIFNGRSKTTFKDNFIGKNVDLIANIRVYDQLMWRLTGSYMMTTDDAFGDHADGLWQFRQALTLTF